MGGIGWGHSVIIEVHCLIVTYHILTYVILYFCQTYFLIPNVTLRVRVLVAQSE